MLDIKNAVKVFSPGTPNEHKALNDLSLHLDKGEYVTIVGSNGAGKSYDQYLVIRDPIPVHSDGRFPGLRIIAEYRLPGFPVAEEELRGFCSPDTVTRSCRIRTCFPFTLSHDCSCCGTALLIQF